MLQQMDAIYVPLACNARTTHWWPYSCSSTIRTLLSQATNSTEYPISSLGNQQALDLSYNQIAFLGRESFPAELGASMRRLSLEGNR